MNKKGFTLAELLGVLVILSIIGTIVFTVVDRKLQESRKKTCLAQETNIIEAAKMWAVDNTKLLNKNSTNDVTIGTLKKENYIEDLTNPMTKTSYNDKTKVVISISDKGVYDYNMVYIDEYNCEKK